MNATGSNDANYLQYHVQISLMRRRRAREWRCCAAAATSSAPVNADHPANSAATAAAATTTTIHCIDRGAGAKSSAAADNFVCIVIRTIPESVSAAAPTVQATATASVITTIYCFILCGRTSSSTRYERKPVRAWQRFFDDDELHGEFGYGAVVVGGSRVQQREQQQYQRIHQSSWHHRWSTAARCDVRLDHSVSTATATTSATASRRSRAGNGPGRRLCFV